MIMIIITIIIIYRFKTSPTKGPSLPELGAGGSKSVYNILQKPIFNKSCVAYRIYSKLT